MSDVIVHSTQYLTDEDALAAAKYLKTIHSPSDTPTAPFTYNKAEHEALRNGDASKPGAMIYLDNCAACHRPERGMSASSRAWRETRSQRRTIRCLSSPLFSRAQRRRGPNERRRSL